MPPPRYPRIALEQLKELQRAAAEAGYDFIIETTDEFGYKTVHPVPKVAKKSKDIHPLPPEGVHFTSSQRVGDEIRDSYIDHIREMFAGGYIDSGEHDARLAAMMQAHTREEMDFLVQDLPKVPEKKPAVTEPATVTRHHKIAVDPYAGFMLTWVSFLGAVATINTVAIDPAGVVVSAVLALLGLVSLVLTVIGIIARRKK